MEKAELQSGHLFTRMEPWVMFLHGYVHEIAWRVSLYSHAELSCTHMTVVTYLHDLTNCRILTCHVTCIHMTRHACQCFHAEQSFLRWTSLPSLIVSIGVKQKKDIFSKKCHFHAHAWQWIPCEHIDALTELYENVQSESSNQKLSDIEGCVV